MKVVVESKRKKMPESDTVAIGELREFLEQNNFEAPLQVGKFLFLYLDEDEEALMVCYDEALFVAEYSPRGLPSEVSSFIDQFILDDDFAFHKKDIYEVDVLSVSITK